MKSFREEVAGILGLQFGDQLDSAPKIQEACDQICWVREQQDKQITAGIESMIDKIDAFQARQQS